MPSWVAAQQSNFAAQKMSSKLTATSKKPCSAGRISATSKRTALSPFSLHLTSRVSGALAVGSSKSSEVPTTPPGAPEAKLPRAVTGAAKTPTTQTSTVLRLTSPVGSASQVPT